VNVGREIVLVHSPLLSPMSWSAVAEALTAMEHRVVVPDLRPVLSGNPPFYARVFSAVAEVIGRDVGSVVLVGHSGAGALLPGIAGALPVPATGLVYVDALLPHPGTSWLESLSEDRAAHLRSLCRDGRLPPWSTWFPAEVLEKALPDEAMRAAFHDDLPELPWALTTEPMPSVVLDPAPRKAYIRLSEAYDQMAASAEESGWPVARLSAGHLAPLTRPGELAELILAESARSVAGP